MSKHAELVIVAERWLRRRHRIVLADVRCSMVSEQPDAIGWLLGGASTLVECKSSRADFMRDKTKSHRKFPDQGVGLHRYYVTPPKLVQPSELPDGWGLLETTAKGSLAQITKSGRFPQRNVNEENRLLLAALVRATEGWGRRMFGKHAPPMIDGDPHPSVASVIRANREETRRIVKAIADFQYADDLDRIDEMAALFDIVHLYGMSR